MKEEKFLHYLKILSVKNRFQILRLLSKERLCVNALSCRLNISPAAVSQHLRILKDNGLLSSEKIGYYMHYTINKDIFEKIKKSFDELIDF
ncbi:MAG: metalloregulator ArsR/SmtB family transcription factor [Candidatus Muiribacteriota bacterium]|jgi:DNA-binding transcriptional ArsR family regulator